MYKRIVNDGIRIHDHIKAAQITEDFEIDRANSKLRMNLVEVKERIAAGTEDANMWEDTEHIQVILKKNRRMLTIALDQQLLFKKDQKKAFPLLERWNQISDMLLRNVKTRTSALNILKFTNNDKNIAFASVSSSGGEDDASTIVRPMAGNDLSYQQLYLVKDRLERWNQLTTSEIRDLDNILSKNNRFFSMFDKGTRRQIYGICKLVLIQGSGVLLERDVDEANKLQVILAGYAIRNQVNEAMDLTLELSKQTAGEVIGDESIQRKFKDPLKCLSMERKEVRNGSDVTYLLQIDKSLFLQALFQEINEDKFYKILLLRRLKFFEELSPYSLYMLASQLEVREYKYGEIIMEQGQIPEHMLIMAYGQCKILYHYVDQKST